LLNVVKRKDGWYERVKGNDEEGSILYEEKGRSQIHD